MIRTRAKPDAQADDGLASPDVVVDLRTQSAGPPAAPPRRPRWRPARLPLFHSSRPLRRLSTRRSMSARLAGVAVAVLALLLAAALLMGMQSPMAISAITTTGASPGLQPQVDAVVGAAVGDTFSSVDAGAVRERILGIEGVEDADVAWSWWNTLSIVVQEQTPLAAAAGPAGGFVVLDAQGQTIRTVPDRPAGLLLFEAGDDEAVRIALRVVERVPEMLVGSVDAVVVKGPNAIELRLVSGATAVLGNDHDLDRKFLVLAQLIGTGAMRINISVPERPAVQGIPAPPR